MIDKQTLQSVISKYYLNGIIESTKWVIKDNILNIKFIVPTKDMLGELTFKNIKLDDTEFVIYNTSQLNKLIGITNGTLLLEIEKNNNVALKMKIADSQFNSVYALADIMLAAKVAAVKEPKEYDVILDINSEQISALIKAKNALPDTNLVNISSNSDFDGNNTIDFILGEKGDHTNKIIYSIPTKNSSLIDIPFNSETLKEILSANKSEEDAKIYISSDGLMKLTFQTDNLAVTYYMVRKQDN